MKTSELTGAALEWAVARLESKASPMGMDSADILLYRSTATNAFMYKRWAIPYSTDWAQGGPIIEREGISVIRLDDESVPDEKGFYQGKYIPQWGAVIGTRHSIEKSYGGQGDYWGLEYHVDGGAICGDTPLIAAMRCYVASKLGDTVDIPKELHP